MRRGPIDSGWAGSLFDEPITLVAAPWTSKPVDTFAGAAFRQPAPKLESNQDESLDFSKEWYYCASGNAIRNHLPCDECIRSEPCEEIHCIRLFKLHPCAYFNSAHCNGSTCEYWSPYGDNPHCTYGPYLAWLAATSVPVADAPTVKGIRMPEYSFATGAKFGEKPEHTEAEAHGDDLCSGCLCHKCDWSQHICKSCEDPAACATRGKHTVACPECSGLKKPSRKALAKAKKQAPTVEHPTLIHYGHETWGRYELEGRLVEEFISTARPVSKESEFAAEMVAVDAARKAAGDLPLARSFIEKGARGIRVYEDPALQEGGTLCCHLVVSKQNGGLCTGCSDQRGTPCSYSRPAEHTSPELAVAPTKLTEWVLLNCGKHHTCRDDCAGRKGGLCPFTVSREGGIPADLLDDRAKDDAEAKAAKKLAKVTKPEPAPTVTPAKEPIALLLPDGKWYSEGKEISEVEARTGGPCDQDHACVIVADPKGKVCDSRYPCRCFHCKGNQGPCGSKCGLYPERTTGGKHGGCCMVQHKAKSRTEVELGVSS